jgi:predicted DNA-binding transcriptional regulator AlpA
MAAQPQPDTFVRNLNVSQAAQYTNLSESFLNRLRSIGGGPTFFKVGSRVLYSSIDIDQWLASRRRTSTSDSGETV